MKRRDFIKTTTAAGITGALSQSGLSAVNNAHAASGPGFDVHPFVKEHPEAVFIVRTSIDSKKNTAGINTEGYKLAKELIV
ncbi:twin-arginine translocation signal domain-containing protein, partial [bacterium]|nr:twin-arginine translocation signal domain-containing protein [bacterium]